MGTILIIETSSKIATEDNHSKDHHLPGKYPSQKIIEGMGTKGKIVPRGF
jgi:hypothetical protein